MSKEEDQNQYVQDAEQEQGHSSGASMQRGKKRESKRVAELEQQVEELTRDLQRERSDFANYQRRMESEKEQIMSYAKLDVVSRLLSVLDDLERALSHIPEELQDNTWAQGVGKVYEHVQEKLQEMGVTRIEALHHPFDPNVHEAVEFEDGEGDEEIVIEVRRTGYMLDDTVLRPAMVRVGKTSKKSHTTNSTDGNSDTKEKDHDVSSENE